MKRWGSSLNVCTHCVLFHREEHRDTLASILHLHDTTALQLQLSFLSAFIVSSLIYLTSFILPFFKLCPFRVSPNPLSLGFFSPSLIYSFFLQSILPSFLYSSLPLSLIYSFFMNQFFLCESILSL